MNLIELAKDYYRKEVSLISLKDQADRIRDQLLREEKETQIVKDKLINACGEKRNFLVAQTTMISVSPQGVSFEKLTDATK